MKDPNLGPDDLPQVRGGGLWFGPDDLERLREGLRREALGRVAEHLIDGRAALADYAMRTVQLLMEDQPPPPPPHDDHGTGSPPLGR